MKAKGKNVVKRRNREHSKAGKKQGKEKEGEERKKVAKRKKNYELSRT
jgi:hypothetical protein